MYSHDRALQAGYRRQEAATGRMESPEGGAKANFGRNALRVARRNRSVSKLFGRTGLGAKQKSSERPWRRGCILGGFEPGTHGSSGKSARMAMCAAHFGAMDFVGFSATLRTVEAEPLGARRGEFPEGDGGVRNLKFSRKAAKFSRCLCESKN